MKRILVFLLLVLNTNVFSQNNHNFGELSKMVFDEINLQRNKIGLKDFVWNDTLLNISKRTNQILKTDNRLHHPSIYSNRDTFNYFEKIFVKQYKKLTNNKYFEYKSADDWGFVRSYSQIGEVIALEFIDKLDVQISKDVVKSWLNSKGHKFWLLIHDTLVENVPYPTFCSCSSDYKLYENKQYIIVTCNMYVVNIKSDWLLD